MNDPIALQTETPRRNFFVAAIYGLGGLIGAVLGGLAGGYLLIPPRSSKKKEAWTPVGELSMAPLGKPYEFVFQKTRVDGWKVTKEKATAWVLKKSENEVVAFAPQCTHLGCAYHWDDKNLNFLCPCHTSVFDKDGKVLTGPAPRPLDRYQSKVENGKIYLGEIVQSEGA